MPPPEGAMPVVETGRVPVGKPMMLPAGYGSGWTVAGENEQGNVELTKPLGNSYQKVTMTPAMFARIAEWRGNKTSHAPTRRFNVEDRLSLPDADVEIKGFDGQVKGKYLVSVRSSSGALKQTWVDAKTINALAPYGATTPPANLVENFNKAVDLAVKENKEPNFGRDTETDVRSEETNASIAKIQTRKGRGVLMDANGKVMARTKIVKGAIVITDDKGKEISRVAMKGKSVTNDAVAKALLKHAQEQSKKAGKTESVSLEHTTRDASGALVGTTSVQEGVAITRNAEGDVVHQSKQEGDEIVTRDKNDKIIQRTKVVGGTMSQSDLASAGGAALLLVEEPSEPTNDEQPTTDEEELEAEPEFEADEVSTAEEEGTEEAVQSAAVPTEGLRVRPVGATASPGATVAGAAITFAAGGGGRGALDQTSVGRMGAFLRDQAKEIHIRAGEPPTSGMGTAGIQIPTISGAAAGPAGAEVTVRATAPGGAGLRATTTTAATTISSAISVAGGAAGTGAAAIGGALIAAGESLRQQAASLPTPSAPLPAGIPVTQGRTEGGGGTGTQTADMTDQTIQQLRAAKRLAVVSGDQGTAKRLDAQIQARRTATPITPQAGGTGVVAVPSGSSTLPSTPEEKNLQDLKRAREIALSVNNAPEAERLGQEIETQEAAIARPARPPQTRAERTSTQGVGVGTPTAPIGTRKATQQTTKNQSVAQRLRSKLTLPMAFASALSTAQQTDRMRGGEGENMRDTYTEAMSAEGSGGRSPIETIPQSYTSAEEEAPDTGEPRTDLQNIQGQRAKATEMRRTQESLTGGPSAVATGGTPSAQPPEERRDERVPGRRTGESGGRMGDEEEDMARMEAYSAATGRAAAQRSMTSQTTGAALAGQSQQDTKDKAKQLVSRILTGVNMIHGLADGVGLVAAFFTLNVRLLNQLTFKSKRFAKMEMPLEGGCVLVFDCFVCLACFCLIGIPLAFFVVVMS